jgi:hypothetical protein
MITHLVILLLGIGYYVALAAIIRYIYKLIPNKLIPAIKRFIINRRKRKADLEFEARRNRYK